eukprot:TRINITY_DN5924_c0_g1_i1.p1 TRINITY_DN5924_c0_g1~~TRINITY_DN5924_c0_g1_i1.p1  ORF type:complete len:324 (-),score=25.89 TRINITY_DN5924_c0_g1_i1:39-956(-)
MGIDGLFSSLAVVDPIKKRRGEKSVKSTDITALLNQVDEADLPPGVDFKILRRALQSSGLSAGSLGFDVPLDLKGNRENASTRGLPTVFLRLILVLFGIWLWFRTEAALESSLTAQGFTIVHASKVELKDYGHLALLGLREYILDQGYVHMLCGLSALLSEFCMLGIIVKSVLGHTFRPFLAVMAVFIIRLLMRFLSEVPYSITNVWALPDGWLTLFIRPETSHIFFSGRVALAMIVAIELFRLAPLRGSILLKTLGVLMLLFQVVLSLALGASWSFDLIIAIITARYSTIFASKFSKFVDAFMP